MHSFLSYLTIAVWVEGPLVISQGVRTLPEQSADLKLRDQCFGCHFSFVAGLHDCVGYQEVEG